MKKLISCLLVVMMLFSVANAFAFAETLEFTETENALSEFLKETDLKTQDIVMQSQTGDETTDLLIRVDGGNLHMVARENGVEKRHGQLNATGIYLADAAADSVTMVRHSTISTVMQEFSKVVDSALEQAAQSTSQEQVLTQTEVKQAIEQIALLASAEMAQEQADASTLTSAAMAFYSKFKPEYILDVKEDDGDVQISLRSDAFATALAEAVDELMMNPALAELVTREAALEGGTTFAEYQKDWLTNREAILEAARSIESTDTLTENGHYTSNFKIGEEFSALKIFHCDTDAWINAEDGKAEAVITMSFEKEDPFMVYEFIVNPNYYWEKLSSGESKTELYYEIEDNRITSGNVVTVIDGNEELSTDFGLDHVNLKGPKGGISSSVRETWTGKTRYQLVAENADGAEATVTADFYEDGDSLVCELYSNDSDQTALFTISRVDKAEIADLSVSKNITEITVGSINAELENLLKLVTMETATTAQETK